MCGRAILVSSIEDIAEVFEIPPTSAAHLAGPPRFNVAPGQEVVVVRAARASTQTAGRPFAGPAGGSPGRDFYEWSGSGKSRRPHYVHLAKTGPFAIAAVWDSWESPDAGTLESCAVVTTAARGPVARLHDRMPLVLDAEARERWLTAPPEEAASIAPLGESEGFVVVPVSTWVNTVQHEGPRCLEPAAPGPAEAEVGRQTAFRFG